MVPLEGGAEIYKESDKTFYDLYKSSFIKKAGSKNSPDNFLMLTVWR